MTDPRVKVIGGDVPPDRGNYGHQPINGRREQGKKTGHSYQIKREGRSGMEKVARTIAEGDIRDANKVYQQYGRGHYRRYCDT